MLKSLFSSTWLCRLLPILALGGLTSSIPLRADVIVNQQGATNPAVNGFISPNNPNGGAVIGTAVGTTAWNIQRTSCCEYDLYSLGTDQDGKLTGATTWELTATFQNLSTATGLQSGSYVSIIHKNLRFDLGLNSDGAGNQQLVLNNSSGSPNYTIKDLSMGYVTLTLVYNSLTQMATVYVNDAMVISNLAGYKFTSASGVLFGGANGNFSQIQLLTNPQAPKITSVSAVSTQRTQNIVITGSGFGTATPYAGDSSFIRFADMTQGNWTAGFEGTFQGNAETDLVALVVNSWTDSQIVLGGFGGAWGSYGWQLKAGDQVSFSVWNAETGGAPASVTTTVVGSPIPALQITTSNIANAISGLPYSVAFGASGGSGTGYKWSLATGSPPLPAGFTLGPSGTLSTSGNPAATPNSYSFTLQVADSSSNTATEKLTITVLAPATPIINNLSPSYATAAGATFTLTVNGADFQSGAIVQWNGSPLPTTFVNDTQLTSSVSASLIATAGNAIITVTNPGGPASSAAGFTINASAYAITSLTPIFATAGGAAFSLTVNGTGFTPGTTVQWNGMPLTTTYGSGTQLTASVAAGLLTSPGNAMISVMDPSGAASSAVTFQIAAQPPLKWLADVTWEVDNQEFLVLNSDGSWNLTDSGGQHPYGVLVNGSPQSSGSNWAGFTLGSDPFPVPGTVASWHVEVMNGQAPRCPVVGSGSNPDSTVSVISSTSTSITIQADDYGTCSGTTTEGRVMFTLRISYLPLPFVMEYVNPKYLVVGVTYAPPGGASSFVSYQNSVTVGNSSTISNSFTDAFKENSSLSVGISCSGNSGSLGSCPMKVVSSASETVTDSQSSSSTQKTTNSNQITLSTTISDTPKLFGVPNAYSPVNHDYDTIWLWLNPVSLFSLYSANGNLGGGPVVWTGYGYDTDDAPGLDIVQISVGYLNGGFKDSNGEPLPLPSALAGRLSRSWVPASQQFAPGQGPGITSADLANILRADPFAYNPYDSNSGYLLFDPGTNSATSKDGRFTQATPMLVNYVPPAPGQSPSTDMITITNQTSTVATQTSDYSYAVSWGLEEKFSIGFLKIINITSDLSQTWTLTWDNVATTATTQTSTQISTAQITSPPACPTPTASCPMYTEPSSFTIYQDNLYGTLLFWPDRYFSISSVAPTTKTIMAGETASFMINTLANAGYTGQSITISAAGLPAGAVSSQNTGAPGNPIPLNISTAPTTPPGNYQFTIAATYGSLSYFAYATLIIAPGTPLLSSLSPNSATAGGPAFSLAVNGSGFASGTTVQWNGSALSTTYVSAGQLTASVPASLINMQGSASVTVVNQGLTSNALTFTINPPTPSLLSLSPNSATAGGPGFTLTVNGSGFLAGSTVQWNGSPLSSTYVTGNLLTAPVAGALITTQGSASVTVLNPGGVTSNALTFTITPPTPSLLSLSPNSATAGGPAFILTVNGFGFLTTSTVQWNGSQLSTNYLSANVLTSSVSSSLIASQNTAVVTVVNPGGVTSNALNFTINPATPTLSNLSPNSETAGGPPFTLTVNGSGFLTGSNVQWNGSPLSTTYASGSQLTASVPGALITSQGTAGITVANPAGATSNSLTFTINPAVPSLSGISPNSVAAGWGSFSMTVNGSGFLPGSVVSWTSAASGPPAASTLGTNYVGGGQLTATVPASLITAQGSAAVTVANSGGPTSNSLPFTIRPQGSLMILTASPLPDGTVGTAYSQGLAATGGVTPYSAWALSAGSQLPPGISLMQGIIPGIGLLSGTPTSSGTFTFTLQVTDAATTVATAPFSIRINSAGLLSVNGIVNAASHASGAVAPGEIVTIFSSFPGPSSGVGLELDNQGRVSTSLGGMQVLFDAVPAPLTYAVSGQVTCIVPYEVSSENVTHVQLSFQDQLSNSVTVPVADAVPGVFTRNLSGTGPGVIVNQDGTTNSVTNPAAIGSLVLVYATGEGQTNPAGVDGELDGLSPPQPVTQPVTATIGGVPSTVVYAGGVSGLVAGLLQVNVEIPQGVSAGNEIPIVLTIGGATSQQNVTIALH